MCLPLVDGKVNAVVFGTGTGGTLAGVGTYLKDKNKNVQVFLADPQVNAFKLFLLWFTYFSLMKRWLTHSNSSSICPILIKKWYFHDIW